MQRFSLFSQRLDRIAFVAYFLGAIVPLGALAVLVATRRPSAQESVAWGAVLAFVGLLSLASFLALRQTTRAALRRMDDDLHRLGALLHASQSLAAQPDGASAAEEAAKAGLKLTGAHVAAVVTCHDRKPSVLAAAGGFAGTATDEARDLAWEVKDQLDALRDQPESANLADAREATLVPLASQVDGKKVALLLAGWKLPESRTEVSAVLTLARLASAALENADLRDAQRNFFSHVTSLLSRALSAHLGHQEDHGHRVALLANRVAHHMGVAGERLQALHWAAVLHDIGMLDIPRDLHDDAEARRPHPRIGAEMLAPIRFFERSAPIVLLHHEHYDGTGYPNGLGGEKIPLEARILAACDAFDAMTHESSYQSARHPDEALDELERCSGTQFDPEVVAAFRALVDEGIIELPAHRDLVGV